MNRVARSSVIAGLVLAIAGASGCTRPARPIEEAGAAVAPDPRGLIHVASPISARTLSVRVSAPHGQSLTVENCNGDPGWRLHRIDGQEAHEVWSGEADACASSPIRIDGGTSHAFDLGAYNGARRPLKAGRYRLVLDRLRWSDGRQVEPDLRRSNDFALEVPGR